jgi:hypothetical protein
MGAWYSIAGGVSTFVGCGNKGTHCNAIDAIPAKTAAIAAALPAPR